MPPSRVHKRVDNSDNMSNASLGTAAAFRNETASGGLFLKGGEYNVEFLQTFITKPLKSNKPKAKPLRQPVVFSEVPPGFKPRTVIYFKRPDLEKDPQQRLKYNLLSKDEQLAVSMQAEQTKQELFGEVKKVRKAWNTPCERPGSLPKPPPRVSLEERKARKAKAEAELENRGALVETVTVNDPSMGGGRWGKRLEIQQVTPASAYNPSSYDTPVSPTKSQFGDDDDDLEAFKRSPPRPVYESYTANELRLLNAARSKAIQADHMKKKVSRLEHFVGDLKKSIVSLKEGETNTLLTSEAATLGEKGMLGTAGGELAAALNRIQEQQMEQAVMIAQLQEEKTLAEKRVKALEKEVVTGFREEKEQMRKDRLNPPSAAVSPFETISVVHELPKAATVEFLTDVEGNNAYLENFLARSRILSVNSTGGYDLSPNGYFVYGGDSVDKGTADIRVVKMLVALKKKYPERVFLILGNRDMNKLRFPAELDEKSLATSSDIYWDSRHTPFAAWCQEKLQQPTEQASKIRWMLECTMGSSTTFETRRMELAEMKLIEKNLVTDKMVTNSFLESVDPKGKDAWMLEYVKLGQLMLILDNSLFVHGGLKENLLGCVPGSDPEVEADEVDAEAWCTALNEWKNDMVRAYVKNPKGEGHLQLLDYGVPGGNRGKTCVYNNMLNNGNCVAPDIGVEEFCEVNGVRRIFVGHQPHGECPSVIKRSSVTIFVCDTSFSDVDSNKVDNPADMRGKAVSMVTIKRDVTRIEGVLKDGKTLNKYEIAVDDSRNNLPDSLVGRQLVDDSWVKGVVDGKVLVAKGEGYKLDVQVKEVKDVLEQLKAQPVVSSRVAMKREAREVEKRSAAAKRAKEAKEAAAKKKSGSLSFLDRQAASQKSKADKLAKKIEEKEKAAEDEAAAFQAKPLKKGAMAANAAKMKKDAEEATKEREAKNKVDALEKSLLSGSGRMDMHGAGHETEAQRKGRERREKELKVALEKDNAL
ncbi:hypothetical protein TrST_g6105 [Triparma strigata]|uniref:Calcineurin-like phosphoesterase domain-containing protein n=1 Tax=Triparma strigata TaxID=1606541 RepID=A0A9W7CC51_9STRA|nr:hypothetical protein TrST_g6105 [Triparma strigata]